MDSLSNDLLLEIFRHLSLRDIPEEIFYSPRLRLLRNICLVNRRFHWLAQAFLYRAVPFTSHFSRDAALLRTLRERPDLALFTRFAFADYLYIIQVIEFVFVNESGKEEFAKAVKQMNLANEDEWLTAVEEPDPEACLAVILFHLPKLTSFRMDLLHLPHERFLRQLAQGATDPSSSLYGRLSNVKSLSAGNMHTTEAEGGFVHLENLIPFLQLPSLEKLYLPAVQIGEYYDNDIDEEMEESMHHRWPAHVPNIKEIEIHYANIKADALRRFLLPFKSLKSLKISWAYSKFAGLNEDMFLPNYTRAILASKASLERLEIDIGANEAVGDLKGLEKLTHLAIHGLALTGDYEEESDVEYSDEDLQLDSPPVEEERRKPPLAIVDALPLSLVELKIISPSLNLPRMLLEFALTCGQLPNLKLVDVSDLPNRELEVAALSSAFSETGVEFKPPASYEAPTLVRYVPGRAAPWHRRSQILTTLSN